MVMPYLAHADGVASLKTFFKATSAMRAHFHQVVTDAQGNKVQEVEGNMQLQRPGKFQLAWAAWAAVLTRIGAGVKGDIVKKTIDDSAHGMALLNTTKQSLCGADHGKTLFQNRVCEGNPHLG